MSERRVRLVLDTSSVLAFASGSVHVGEPLSLLPEEDGSFGVPVVCLAEAWRSVDDAGRSMIDALAGNPAFVALGTDAAHWRALARWADVLGAVDAAASVVASAVHQCLLLTARGDLYRDRHGKELDFVVVAGPDG